MCSLVVAIPNFFQVLPRYARINRLRVSKEVAVAQFKKDGYTLVTVDELFKTNTTRDRYFFFRIPIFISEFSKIFAIDPDICDGHLLVFPPFTDLHAHPYVVSGSVILQDKASAFSGWALDAPPGCTALDRFVEILHYTKKQLRGTWDEDQSNMR